MDTEAFGVLLYQYGFGYLTILSPLIVLIEILLGLLLILLINPKLNSILSFSLLLLFSIFFVYGHYKYGINNCGCLGTLQPVGLSPVFSFVRNFILLSMALVVWAKYPKQPVTASRWKILVIFCMMLVSSFIAGLTFKQSVFLKQDNANTTAGFQNKKVQNTALSKYIKTSPDSVYLAFCFSYTCPHCWNSIANLRQFKKTNVVDRIIAFGTGTDSSRLFFVQNFHPDFSIKDLPVNEMLKLTNLFPTAFYIKHDSVKSVILGELPSPIVFKSQYSSFNVR